MADASTSSAGAGGEASFAYMFLPSVTKLTQEVLSIIQLAQDRGLERVLKEALDLLITILKDVNRISVEMAGKADEMMIEELHASHTAQRPRMGDLETHIVSKPGPLGEVRVALIAELDRIINPEGNWGTYWRAQEFGTGKSGSYLEGNVSVPSQIGRRLVGFFDDGKPDINQQGLNQGESQSFTPDRSGGLGTISVDLPGRHFLTKGAIRAGEAYIAAIAAAQERWVATLRDMSRLLAEELAAMGRDRLIVATIRS